MKRTAGIIIILSLLFSSTGYQAWIYILESRLRTEFEAKLDRHEYEESELISIKIPVRHLPYHYNSAEFERVVGELEVEGWTYHFVKRRIMEDTVELLCIANSLDQKLLRAKAEISSEEVDWRVDGKRKSSSCNTKNFRSDDYAILSRLIMGELGFVLRQHSSWQHPVIPSIFPPAIEKPPESCPTLI